MNEAQQMQIALKIAKLLSVAYKEGVKDAELRFIKEADADTVYKTHFGYFHFAKKGALAKAKKKLEKRRKAQ